MTGIEVRDDEGEHRYLAVRGGETVGYAAYRREAGVTTFTHTVVEPRHEGEGVGSALVGAALDAERAAGRTVVPRCPFVRSYLTAHPGYADLLA